MSLPTRALSSNSVWRGDGQVTGLEATWIRSDGTQIFVRENCHAICDASGKILYYDGTAEDITDRKRAEDQLRQIHNQYHELVEHAHDGIFVLDTDGCFQLVNDELCNMLGYAREELIGMSILDTYPLDIREEGGQRLARIQTGHAVQFERPMIRKDGSVITIEASAWKTEDGNVQAIVRDVTKRKLAEEEKAKLEAQLQQAQKMESVGRLAGGVAHDFNNMLGVIIGHSEMALEMVDQTQPLYDDLQEIRKAAERSANLTRKLLAFARKQTVAPRVIDVNETVSGMVNMLRKAHRRGHKTQLESG